MPAITLAAIEAAVENSFLQAVADDRSERWVPPSADQIAPELTRLEILLANLALDADQPWRVREAATAAFEDPESPGIVTLMQALVGSKIGVALEVLITERYNAGH